MNIESTNDYCTVIVTVDGEATDIESVLDHASDGLNLFEKFNGFISGATHISDDRKRIIQYLQWENKESHEACLADSSWSKLESSKHFIELMETGTIKVIVKTYLVINSKN